MSWSYRNLYLSGVFLLFGTSLTACGNDSAFGENLTIAGQFVNWSGGADQRVSAGFPGKAANYAPIDAAGNFAVQAPSGAGTKLDQHQEDNPPNSACFGAIKNEPAMYTYSQLEITTGGISGKKGYPFLQNLAGAAQEIIVTYAYYDRDVEVNGQIDCPATERQAARQTIVAIHVKQGWNRVIYSSQPAAGSMPSLSKIYTGAIPEGVGWLIRQ